MQKIEFPKWKYHATKEAVIVPHEDAERALGPGWAEHPDHVMKAEPVAEVKKVSKSQKPKEGFKA